MKRALSATGGHDTYAFTNTLSRVLQCIICEKTNHPIQSIRIIYIKGSLKATDARVRAVEGDRRYLQRTWQTDYGEVPKLIHPAQYCIDTSIAGKDILHNVLYVQMVINYAQHNH